MRIRIVPYEQLVDQDKNARGVFAKKWEVCVECDSLEKAERLKEALAQSDQESDDLTIAYMSGFFDGKKKREWVGLTDEEAAECWNSSAVTTWKNIEAKLREKNGC